MDHAFHTGDVSVEGVRIAEVCGDECQPLRRTWQRDEVKNGLGSRRITYRSTDDVAGRKKISDEMRGDESRGTSDEYMHAVDLLSA